MDGRNLWRDSAACRGADPELFFPLTESGPSLVQIRQARQVPVPRAQSGTGRERP